MWYYVFDAGRASATVRWLESLWRAARACVFAMRIALVRSLAMQTKAVRAAARLWARPQPLPSPGYDVDVVTKSPK